MHAAVRLTSRRGCINGRRHPDGAWVLFVSDRDGAETLWLMDVESQVTRQRRLFYADTWPRDAC